VNEADAVDVVAMIKSMPNTHKCEHWPFV